MVSLCNRWRGIVRCPECNARFYPKRSHMKMLSGDGRYMVECGCGLRYWVLAGTHCVLIRRYRDGE